MVKNSKKELKYLNLDNFEFVECLDPSKDLPPDYSVYIVAKWCRRVSYGDLGLNPHTYCEFANNLDKYEFPVFER